MKLKKILPVAFVLLAILIIGTVSAADNAGFNETLTTSNVQETLNVSAEDSVILGEMSHEDVNIEVNNISTDDSGTPFVDVYLTEKDGNFVICKSEGEDTLEIYREGISESDKVDEGETYHLGVSLDDVNAFIANRVGEESNFYDVVAPQDILKFVLEYMGDDFTVLQYSVEFDENNIFLNFINQNQISSFFWNPEYDGPLYSDYEECVLDVSLPEGTMGTVIVFVDENEFRWEIDSDYRQWSLQDLEITEPGEYEIVVKYIGEDDSEEIISEGIYNVVKFNNDAFRADISYDKKRINFFCPEGSEGTITITVERYDEDEDTFIFFDEFSYEINDDYYGQWVELPFSELNIPVGTGSRIIFDVSDEQYSHAGEGLFRGFVDIYIYDVFENGIIYSDNNGYILELSPNEGFDFAMAEIIVNGISRFNTKLYFPADYYHYRWSLETLNMTEPGEYDITIKIITEEYEEIYDYTFNVVEFENDTFRAKYIAHIEEDDENADLSFFCPEGASGNVTLTLGKWDDDENMAIPVGEYTYEINSTMYNKWTVLKVAQAYYDAQVRVDDYELCVEGNMIKNHDDFSFDVNDWGNIYEDNTVARVDVPFDKTDSNVTFSIRGSECEIFSIRLSELQGRDYEWRVSEGFHGCYVYEINLEDVDSFKSLSDRDEVLFNLSVNHSIGASGHPYWLGHIQKDDGFIGLHVYEAIRINLVEISLGEYDEEEGRALFNISEDSTVLFIDVPDELNITETAIVQIAYADKLYSKNLKDLDCQYQYNYMGYTFNLALSDLNPKNLKNGDIINITLINDGEIIGYKTITAYINDEGLLGLDDFRDSIDLEFHFGEIGHAEYGMGISDGTLMVLTIPDYLNVTDGAIQLIADDGTVLFSKSLSQFDENSTSHDGIQSMNYVIFDDLNKFDYSCIPQGINFTASFTYDNITLPFQRGVRQGDCLRHINTPVEIFRLFKVTVSEDILCNGEDNAIIIEATNEANRQSIDIDIGGGYFAVYVNGKKVEDMGRLVRVDNETELDLFRLCSNYQGTIKLQICLPDINVTENGIYNIRVTHMPRSYEDSFHNVVETELFNRNITLTSNVKVNYQNNTTEVFTGYGFDPVLLYLDTYYDDISKTNGTITVLNSKGNQLLSKNIKNLQYKDGRYCLSYSDFENKDFGDKITVRYANGNERDGETTLGVMWKDVESDDFAPTVNDNVEDYYSDFVNMNIPELINTGQIMVTVKFKNNHGSNISNMNVTTDFGSQAVYRFNVADIKANYENNDFNLALSDLGFYEADGNYDVVVQFTADGSEALDITNNTLKVELSKDILLSINKTSRYANALPFASVKVFEPISAYAELYIDGVLYSHKTFEKGIIKFDSLETWAPGNHTAELIVFDSEFGTVLNSSTVTFENMIQTDDVDVNLNETVKEGEDVYVTFDVPKDSEAFIQIDNGEKVKYALKSGKNAVNLGVLPYGNHTIGIAYNTTLDDGSSSFYTNFLSVFVGDDGSWLTLPEPLVLENDDTIKMDFGADAQGNVVVTIDDVVVANKTLVNGTADVTLTDLITGVNKYGKHTYNITYSGDKNHDSLSKAGEFDVTYLFKDNLVKDGFPLRETYEVIITLPNDAKGSVTLDVEGKQYTSQVRDGQATFEVPNLSMGEHDVNVSYSGDDKYPSTSYSNVLNVSYYAVVGDFKDKKRAVSLILPANATGNLTVYNDNRQEKLFSVPLVKGKASVDLSKLTVGKYELRAVYEGDDNDVRQFETQFDVLPKIYISQNVTVGEMGQIFVDLDNSTGHLLILVEEASPVLLQIENGKVNYTFDTEGLSKGNHSVSFQYFGNSFDGNVFYAFNNQTGYFMPINYNMHLLPKSPQVNMTPGDEWVIIDCGNATGTIEVFVNGQSIGVVDIVNGIAMVDLSNFKDGNYNITFKYSGDRMYDGFTKDLEVTVFHKVPKITAKNAKVLYTAKGKYSVTVYDSEGNISAGTEVTFLIGGNVYKTAKTNSKGVASIVIGKKPGSYKITAIALNVNVTNKLTVKHLLTLKKVAVKKSAKKLVLQATLSKVNKKYLKGKKITFKFNGKKYTAKTNKKGVAKLTIKSSVLKKLKVGKKITYQATYLKDTVKNKVKVKK